MQWRFKCYRVFRKGHKGPHFAVIQAQFWLSRRSINCEGLRENSSSSLKATIKSLSWLLSPSENILIEQQLQMPGILSTQLYLPNLEPENNHWVYTEHSHFCCLAVLGLLGMELIIIITGCSVLWPSSVTKTVLAAHQCFSSCWTVLAQHQELLCSDFAAPASRLRVGSRLEEGVEPGQLTPTDQREIPYHVICSAIISGSEREE